MSTLNEYRSRGSEHPTLRGEEKSLASCYMHIVCFQRLSRRGLGARQLAVEWGERLTKVRSPWSTRSENRVKAREAGRGHVSMNRNLPRVAYRPREAAEVTGLSLRFLYYAIQHRDLPTVRVGRCRLITEKALREWLERKAEGTAKGHG